MLLIRKEQLAAFEASRIDQANARLAQYARRRFPDRFVGTPERDLIGFAAEIRSRARPHGIVEEPDVATALDLTVMYGPDFYASDWARDVFAVVDWSGSRKIAVVRERVRRRLPDF